VGAVLVEDDGVDEAPLKFDGRVLVADRGGERRAPGLVLLDLALADLVGEVLVLVLGEGCVDAWPPCENAKVKPAPWPYWPARKGVSAFSPFWRLRMVSS